MKKLQVFLSSAMNGELNIERELIRFLFHSDHTLTEFFDLFAIEEHASPSSIETAYCGEVKDSDIIIFLFNKELRSAVLKEYEVARENNKIIFIYIKKGNTIDYQLQNFITSEVYHYNPSNYTEPNLLCDKLKNDLLNDLLKIYSKQIKLLSEQENVQYTRKSTLTPYSVYRFFKIDELLEIAKVNEIENSSTDQLISLSTLFIETKGDYKYGLLLIELALIREPNNWILHNDRGLILDTMGLSNAALFNYKKSIELNENNETAHYNIGGIYFKLADYEEAIKYYLKAIEINPEKKNAVNQIAASYLLLKKPAESLLWAKRAFELQQDESTIINLISSYVLNNNFIESLTYLELLKNSEYNYYNLLSYIQYKQGKYVDAINIIDMFYEKGYLEYDGAERKFNSLVSLKLESESFEWFKIIEATYPITAYDYNNLGYKYIEISGKSEFATYFFKKALEIDKNLLPSWQNLQYNLMQLGNYDLSIEICEETLKIFPFDKKTIQNKARSLLELGAFSETIKFNMEKTIALVSSEPNQDKIKEIVEQSFKVAGIDLKNFDELFKSFYELNKLLNKPSL